MPVRHIADIAADLKIANDGLLQAEMAESTARKEATQALNRVNELQKEFDAAVLAMKNSSGLRTDWRTPRNPLKAVG